MALVLGALALFAAFVMLRRALGLGLEPDAIREAVDEMGVWAPLVFVAIVAFRIPLMVPSALILIAGGLVFGSVEGTLYGAAGLVLSALVLFLTSRWAGRDAVEARLPARLRDRARDRRLARGRAVHRGGHGVSAQPDLRLPAARGGHRHGAARVHDRRRAPGSLGRAALYTYFGSSLAEAEPAQLLLAGGLVLAALLVPLVFPGSRAWLLQAFRSAATPTR